MKQILSFLILAFTLSFTNVNAQNAQQARATLDKVAKVIGHSGGASAAFTMTNSNGTVSGTIAVKGNKFNARTPQAIVWYNGNTQWTYMKKNDEVNVSNPTQAQQQMMNPYAFINIYKTGYDMSMKTSGNIQEIHLTAQNKSRSIQELYISVNKKTHVPTVVKMKHGQKWSTITVKKFSTKNLPNSMFSFNSKDYPSAEVIDLR